MASATMWVPFRRGRVPCAKSALRHRRLRAEQLVLGVSERPTPREETQAFGGFDAEAAAPAGHHVDHQLRVLPRLELRSGDPHRNPVPDIEDGEQDVAVADEEFAVGVAHRRRPVAASAGLVEYQRAVALLQFRQQVRCGPRDQRPRWGLLSLPSRRKLPISPRFWGFASARAGG